MTPKPGVHTHKVNATTRDVYFYAVGGRTRLGRVTQIQGRWYATPTTSGTGPAEGFPTMSSAVAWIKFRAAMTA